MPAPLSREQLIQSLALLGQELRDGQVPSGIIERAVAANPWFTPFYIRHSLAHIASWLNRDTLQKFCASYPSPKHSLKVGIITAGNIPLVGFHDVLVGILSGHQVWIQPSRRDRVLMAWVWERWTRNLPALETLMVWDGDLRNTDFLIATGSDNTRRYLDHQFSAVPRLLRRHRYSVAWIGRDTTEADWEALRRDILLYNGLGCRNVSNLIIEEGTPLPDWAYLFNGYTRAHLNPWYLKKVQWERAQYQTMEIPFQDGKLALFRENTAIGPAPMGLVWYIYTNSMDTAGQWIEKNKDQIQCVVNTGTKFGQTQYPAIDTFADDIDTMELLTSLDLRK